MTETQGHEPTEAEARIREELEKAASLISGARRLMTEGRTVELGALEERMRAVSQAVRAAPDDVAQGYKEHLNALMEALDALEADLENQHQALETGLQSIRRREAQGAYAATSPPRPAHQATAEQADGAPKTTDDDD